MVFAYFYRLIPHALRPPNVVPIGAMGLYGGARYPLWQALLMPLLPLFLSDLALRYFLRVRAFDSLMTPLVYGSYCVYVILGRLLLRKSRSPGRIALVSAICSVQFYLITNFGVWYKWDLYPHTFAGLIACYAAGLRYLTFTVGGDLGFCAAMFAVHEWVKAYVTEEEELPAEALAAETEPAAKPQPEESAA
jgi:hypothetical protein